MCNKMHCITFCANNRYLYTVFSPADSRKGSGEDVPVPDSSVDLITCAQSMHWFDMEKFFTECDRVLKPNGCIAAYGNGIPLPCSPNQEIQRVMQEMFMEVGIYFILKL